MPSPSAGMGMGGMNMEGMGGMNMEGMDHSQQGGMQGMDGMSDMKMPMPAMDPKPNSDANQHGGSK